jgi:malonyl CoA-acyl carrier protein transacylase
MPAITLAISEVEKMTINSKQNCISDLCASILRTASWRRALQAKYINDPRNGRAAETLFRLADEAVNLSDEQWAELQPFYSWASQTWCEAVSQTWCEAVSQAARHVEFQRNIRTFPAFVQNLVCILSEQRVAAS